MAGVKRPRKRQKVTHTKNQADETPEPVQLFPNVILPQEIYKLIAEYIRYHQNWLVLFLDSKIIFN